MHRPVCLIKEEIAELRSAMPVPFHGAIIARICVITVQLDKAGIPALGDCESVGLTGASTGGNAWFYLTAASRDYGLTSGTRDTAKIALEELGRDILYAPNPDAELAAKKQAFLRIEIFKKVLEYYKGSNLPDMKYPGNTLTKKFGLILKLTKNLRESFVKIATISGSFRARRRQQRADKTNLKPQQQRVRTQ